MDRQNRRRYASIFDVQLVQREGPSMSTVSISSLLPSPALRAHSRSHRSTPLPLPLDMSKVQAMARPIPSPQLSLNTYQATYGGESHSRTPSGKLYKNKTFASALHMPSSPVTLSAPPAPRYVPSYAPSPLSQITFSNSSTLKETPPTSPEPIEEESCYSLDIQYECIDEEDEYGESDESGPIPQSYSAMALWNDYQTNELFQRLAGASPTFRHYEQPPSRVLDLGCGEGTWVKYAAFKWNSPDTHIDGFDIESLWATSRRHLDISEASARITWTVGNFLDRLPYEQGTFDLVRVANLGLCVPKDYWLPLLLEIRRVLRSGGRLELIDDEFFFPPLQHASVLPCPRLSKEVDHDDKLSKFWEQEENKRLAQYLEMCFGKMLRRKYGVYRAHRHIMELLPIVFGEENTVELCHSRIAIPHRVHRERTRSVDDDRTSRKISFSQISRPHTPHNPNAPTAHVQYTHDPYDPEPMLPSSASQKAIQVLCIGRKSGSGDLPDFLPPKAAKILATATAPRPYQPAGFLVYPDKFYECRPDVLEMHACKNMHIVLSYKKVFAAWLKEHMHELTDLGEDLTEEDFSRMFEDAMWQYDSFKRRRLNWPADYPGLLMRVDDEDSEAVSSRGLSSLVERRRRAQSTSCTLVHPMRLDECTQVRVIRVFGAIKTK